MTGSAPLFDYAAPTADDRAAVWQLAQSADSSAVYLLWLADYAETSLIARLDGQAVGCIVGRRLMSQPDELVVLALAVSPEHRTSEVCEQLLFELVRRMSDTYPIRTVEAAVEGPSGRSISRVFQTVGDWLDAPVTGVERSRDGIQIPRIGPLSR